MDLKELRSSVTGAITTSEDSHYERLRRSMVWNQLVPDRGPRIIVQAANENAVVEAVRFARTNGMKVAVRGGGHNWIGFSLRDDSLLIDLGRLRNVSLDREARIAVIQPAVSSRDFNRRLAAEGLAFPVGHCPTVPMSGFLLNGGIGWNFNAWGASCLSIEAARVVTAEGSLIVASDSENADLLWAVRGAGPAFFGVVTEYTLRAFPAPGAITTSNYYFPLERAGDSADGPLASRASCRGRSSGDFHRCGPASDCQSMHGEQGICLQRQRNGLRREHERGRFDAQLS